MQANPPAVVESAERMLEETKVAIASKEDEEMTAINGEETWSVCATAGSSGSLIEPVDQSTDQQQSSPPMNLAAAGVSKTDVGKDERQPPKLHQLDQRFLKLVSRGISMGWQAFL